MTQNFDSILPPLEESAPEEFTLKPEDLPLIRRILTFASAQVPVEDNLGNKIYPTEETRKHARDLEERLDAAGVAVPAGLYTAFDPFEARDRIATARYNDPDGYTHDIRGLVTGVEQLEDGSWSIRLGKTEFFYKDPQEVKANISIELPLE